MTVAYLLLAALSHSTVLAQENVTGSFTDPRDGQTYRTVKIGNQWWMAQNLNYVTDNGSWGLTEDSTGVHFGRYYNWAAAKQAVPPGWHLPSKQEFKVMLSSIGSGDIPNWGELYPLLIEGGASGFNVQLTGSHQDGYGRWGHTASFWSSDLWWLGSLFPIFETPWRLSIRRHESYVNIGNGAKSSFGFNVRCIKDE